MPIIRKGTHADIDAIMACYEAAKAYMRTHGNHNQWTNGYPSRKLIETDIALGHNYIGTDMNGEIIMTFALIFGDDPTYAIIENGHWLDNRPYATIHRLASNGKQHHILKACVEFCFSKTDNLRLDTHADNLTMQHAALNLGFIPCGTIHLADGSPRIAFQKSIYNPPSCF